jgi:hypothetical protein
MLDSVMVLISRVRLIRTSVPHRSRRSGAHAKAPTDIVRDIDQQELGRVYRAMATR